MTAPAQATGTPAPGGTADGPLLSVVVAAVDVEDTIDACLTALCSATAHLPAEILVVDGSIDHTLQRARRFAGVSTIAAPPGTLVPMLWARGLEASRGPLVAFSLGRCLVAPAWADRMVSALETGAAGAGGGFALAAGTRPPSWALFYLRYSAFIEERWSDGPVEGEIAGDNAVYRRGDLPAEGISPDAGFWEVEVHRWLRERGRRLVAVRGAAAAIAGRVVPRTVLRERFRHGRQFGAARAASGMSRARLIGVVPLVPFVLALRAARRVWRYPAHRRRLALAMPWLLLFAAAWAVGEGAGAWAGQARPVGG